MHFVVISVAFEATVIAISNRVCQTELTVLYVASHHAESGLPLGRGQALSLEARALSS